MILRTLVLRPIVARPVRFLVTVFGVALGVAAMVSTLASSRAAVASLSADIDEIAGAQTLEVRGPEGVDSSLLEELRPFAGEVVLQPVVEEIANVPALGDLVRVLGIDLLLASRDTELAQALESDDGSVLDRMLVGSGVALPRPLADELDLADGDPVDLIVRGRPVTLDVALVFDPPFLASAWSRVFLVDVDHARALFERGSRVDRIELRPRSAMDLDDLEALTRRIAARLPEGHRVGPASQRRSEGGRMVSALAFNLGALAGVSMLVGIVLVGTTLATSIVQRKGRIALLVSLGASRAQLTCAVLAEATAIAALGGPLGVFLGWLGARASVAGMRMTYATVAPGTIAGEVRLEPRWVVLGLGCGLAASLVAAVLPLREALRTPPLQGLQHEHPESVTERRFTARVLACAALLGGAFVFTRLPPIEDRPVWALMAALCLLAILFVMAAPLVDLCAAIPLRLAGRRIGTALRVAQAALEAGRRRAGWAAGAVGVAVGLAVSMATMVGSFRQTVVDWTRQTMRSDLFVRSILTDSGVGSGLLDPDVVEIARALFGDEAVDPYRPGTAWVDGQRVELAGAGFHVVAREGGVPFLGGRPSQDVFAEALRDGSVVVNEPFARRFDAWTGDVVAFETPAGTIERRIAGVYRDYSGHTGRAVLDQHDWSRFYPDEGVQSVAVFLPPGADVAAAQARLRTALDGRFRADVLLNREVRARVLTVFERTFAVTIALQVLAAAIAALAVVTVLAALVQERSRDLAVIRVLGGSRMQVAGVVLGEALLLGLAGAAGGIVVGLAVGYVLVAIVNVQSFGWTVAFLVPWRSLASTLAFVVPACVLAGLVPAVLSARHAPREDLREVA